jgi:DNA replication protein DnaC
MPCSASIDQRYNRVSTIITTSLDLTDWYELFEKKHLGKKDGLSVG